MKFELEISSLPGQVLKLFSHKILKNTLESFTFLPCVSSTGIVALAYSTGCVKTDGVKSGLQRVFFGMECELFAEFGVGS